MIHSLSHLSDQALLRDLATLVGHDRATTADLLAHLAEVDARRLYVPAGYSSMYAYCVDELHLSEDAAYKRIQAARAARQFPVLFTALAQGRLHLAAVCLLAPHLNRGNVDELIAAAAHQRKSEIERRLATRFPRTELLGLVAALPTHPGRPNGQLAPGQVGVETSHLGAMPGQLASEQVRLGVDLSRGVAGDSASAHREQVATQPGLVTPQLAQGQVVAHGLDQPGHTPSPLAPRQTNAQGSEQPGHGAGQLAPGQVIAQGSELSGNTTSQPAPGQVGGGSPSPTSRLAPSAAERYRLELTIGKGTYDNLRYAQALLSHSIPSGDLAQLLDRALSALIRELEKRKLGTGRKPRRRLRSSASGRYVSKRVRRAVWERDEGQCTFVSQTGHRCTERRFLEFDHIDPVARGGRATIERLRLRCRAHNQYEAEREFGTEFMSHKREQARARRTQKRPLLKDGPDAGRVEETAKIAPYNVEAVTGMEKTRRALRKDGHAGRVEETPRVATYAVCRTRPANPSSFSASSMSRRLMPPAS